ncbi:glycosyltransferase [Pedobacter jeongneungensis]|uniref:glycosyltransferase n=1 Tax=Pedobacter jeongneungensis TaxID=947309 RepID=UPI0004699FF0|nr:glycosyltransferase [Pedobacter jeongneungensis]
MTLAPIILFVYNRPENTAILLESLAKNILAKDSTLYIYADGPKEDATPAQLKKVRETRELIKSSNWCGQNIIVESEINIGLAKSIINGVTQLVNEHGRVIVLEDDLKLSPYFLSYMNDSLEKYKDDKQVGQIGACNFFACGNKYPSAFFVPSTDCWGWATWADRWAKYEYDATTLYEQLKKNNLLDQFNLHGNAKMEDMLLAQINKEINTWDIQWLAVNTLNNWFVLYPNPSASQHIFLGNATHNTSNIVPPLLEAYPLSEKVKIETVNHVMKAMELGYSGHGDYYGKPLQSNSVLWRLTNRIIKKILSFFQSKK